ncbi:unnamed protein product [Rotaria sp. Silwood2]|nr:unnamed protein product [Rotaria sp. Silwood2]
MGNCFRGFGGSSDLIHVVAFDYEVDPASVIIVSQVNNFGQGIYQVTFPGLTTPIRYDRVGTVYMRHSSAPPLPHEQTNSSTPAGTPSNHPVIQYAAVDNQVPADAIKMIKMTEERGSGTYHLNVNGNRMFVDSFCIESLKSSSSSSSQQSLILLTNRQSLQQQLLFVLNNGDMARSTQNLTSSNINTSITAKSSSTSTTYYCLKTNDEFRGTTKRQ